MSNKTDPFGVKDTIDTPQGKAVIYRIDGLNDQVSGDIAGLPFSIRILLESIVRNIDGKEVTQEAVASLAGWRPGQSSNQDIPYIPSRVILQDFTGVPAVVDLAAMRSAMQRLGGEPATINPVLPADLIIDHSIQVDCYGKPNARKHNEEREFARNKERYAMLRWAQQSFANFKVVPPGRGIVHQVNLEYLASVVTLGNRGAELLAYPDTLVGTDSHTTMINSLGVLGWGVGGIEAEAVLLGRPYYMPVPEVVGMRFTGELGEGVFATDLVLTVTKMLREHGVVGKFVEFFGPGLKNLTLPDRATIANMAPEYGATTGFFPVDEETLRYLLLSGRKPEYVDFVRSYLQKQGLFVEDGQSNIQYSSTVELDLGSVDPGMAGPKRPQDRIQLNTLGKSFHATLSSMPGSSEVKYNDSHFSSDFNRWQEEGGLQDVFGRTHSSGRDRSEEPTSKNTLTHGSVVIAAITSCTNTSNPQVMIGAGLVAKRCVELGLTVKPWVKNSLAPGSRVVSEYLEQSGLLIYLEKLGFNIVGYGCTTCIGNSGPLPVNVADEIQEKDLTVAAVLSGNRNFEGRINALVRANYLASPPLVVAFAVAGTVDIDIVSEPLGSDSQGRDVHLKDIWPRKDEINKIVKDTITPEMFSNQYSSIFQGTEQWNELSVTEGELYKWDPESTYIREPPFFMEFPAQPPDLGNISDARVLAYLGDSITTDHISPAGAIPESWPSGRYLMEKGIDPDEFNSYGSRRGNHEVMMRGTFSNIRLQNKLAPGKEGGWTRHFPSKDVMTIYDASQRYVGDNVPLIVIAGKEYGTGSSRDWAAKGTFLLGVRAVIAQSYERIHRSNLVGMGVFPLQFIEGESADLLGLTGEEKYDILRVSDVKPKGEVRIEAKRENSDNIVFKAIARLDSPVEMEYFRNGGILHKFLRDNIGRR